MHKLTVCVTACPGWQWWKHHPWLVDSSHTGPVMQRVFPCPEVVMPLNPPIFSLQCTHYPQTHSPTSFPRLLSRLPRWHKRRLGRWRRWAHQHGQLQDVFTRRQVDGHAGAKQPQYAAESQDGRGETERLGWEERSGGGRSGGSCGQTTRGAQL